MHYQIHSNCEMYQVVTITITIYLQAILIFGGNTYIITRLLRVYINPLSHIIILAKCYAK